MKSSLIIFFFFTVIMCSLSQDRILYDLDSYKRVDVDLRTTFFSPDASFQYDNVVNNPGSNKNYIIKVGGNLNDYHLINNEKIQESRYHSLNTSLSSGSSKNLMLLHSFQKEKRHYDGARYFKSGISTNSNISYSKDANLFARYSQFLSLEFDLGFGFGRLEVVNNAWIGARILEELDSKKLLKTIPDDVEMKMFFDLIGDLEFERVMDFRLKDIYVVEKIIEFVEQKGWIEKGSINAFVNIYDTFRYEDFIFRMSGERLEFTLTPVILGSYNWRNNSVFSENRYIEPGFIGEIEYELHENGDLEYYKTKILGARLTHRRRIMKDQIEDMNRISGELYFKYRYRYIPSLRTNLTLSIDFSGGFDYDNSTEASMSASSNLSYRYYVSPSTQLVLNGSIYYNDQRFQTGDYQPSVSAFMSFDIIHAIR